VVDTAPLVVEMVAPVVAPLTVVPSELDVPPLVVGTMAPVVEPLTAVP